MGHRSQGNEWRTVSGPHALVFLEANQPRQSLVDPGINHGFEPDYGGGPGGDRHKKARRAAARGQDELGCGRGRPALGRTSGLDMCCARRLDGEYFQAIPLGGPFPGCPGHDRVPLPSVLSGHDW